MSTLLLRSVMIFVSRTCPESETIDLGERDDVEIEVGAEIIFVAARVGGRIAEPEVVVRLFWLEYPTEVKKATFSVPPEILTLYCCWGDTPASKIRFM